MCPIVSISVILYSKMRLKFLTISLLLALVSNNNVTAIDDTASGKESTTNVIEKIQISTPSPTVIIESQDEIKVNTTISSSKPTATSVYIPKNIGVRSDASSLNLDQFPVGIDIFLFATALLFIG